MKLYEFTLPVKDNKGRSYARQIQSWKESVLYLAGGYTDCGQSEGAWLSPEGQTYLDKVRLIRVGCSLEVRNRLLQIAFNLFDDQEAIAVAELGELHIVERAS